MNNSRKLSGVILAAGMGRRMGKIGKRFQKAMLPICNRPLIEHHVHNMKTVGITNIVIVIGHDSERVKEAIGDGSALGVSIRFVQQGAPLGIAHAVGLAKDLIEDAFLLVLGDIYYMPRDLQGMVDQYFTQGEGIVLAVKEESDPAAIRKNFSVSLNDNQQVTRVIEKPRSVSNRLKGVGLYLFESRIFEAIARTPRTAFRNEYEITESIQIGIDMGMPTTVSYAIEDDINLTFPEDLLDCNLRVSSSMTDDNLLGDNLSLHPDVQLNNCVIGSNVQIEKPVSIRNSLILDNTRLALEGEIEGFIYGPELAIDCCHQKEQR